ELRSLAGLNPTLRAAHVRDAHPEPLRVHATNVFVNKFRLVPCRLDGSWLRDQGGHDCSVESPDGLNTMNSSGYEDRSEGSSRSLSARSSQLVANFLPHPIQNRSHDAADH